MQETDLQPFTETISPTFVHTIYQHSAACNREIAEKDQTPHAIHATWFRDDITDVPLLHPRHSQTEQIFALYDLNFYQECKKLIYLDQGAFVFQYDILQLQLSPNEAIKPWLIVNTSRMEHGVGTFACNMIDISPIIGPNLQEASIPQAKAIIDNYIATLSDIRQTNNTNILYTFTPDQMGLTADRLCYAALINTLYTSRLQEKVIVEEEMIPILHEGDDRNRDALPQRTYTVGRKAIRFTLDSYDYPDIPLRLIMSGQEALQTEDMIASLAANGFKGYIVIKNTYQSTGENSDTACVGFSNASKKNNQKHNNLTGNTADEYTQIIFFDGTGNTSTHFVIPKTFLVDSNTDPALLQNSIHIVPADLSSEEQVAILAAARDTNQNSSQIFTPDTENGNNAWDTHAFSLNTNFQPSPFVNTESALYESINIPSNKPPYHPFAPVLFIPLPESTLNEIVSKRMQVSSLPTESIEGQLEQKKTSSLDLPDTPESQSISQRTSLHTSSTKKDIPITETQTNQAPLQLQDGKKQTHIAKGDSIHVQTAPKAYNKKQTSAQAMLHGFFSWPEMNQQVVATKKTEPVLMVDLKTKNKQHTLPGLLYAHAQIETSTKEDTIPQGEIDKLLLLQLLNIA